MGRLTLRAGHRWHNRRVRREEAHLQIRARLTLDDNNFRAERDSLLGNDPLLVLLLVLLLLLLLGKSLEAQPGSG
jgi:hypothetical protein